MAISHGKAKKKAARTSRLAAALRENLKRRKTQTRGRAQSHGEEKAAAPAEGMPEAPNPDFRRNRGRD
jgi:hypothetical protein